MLRIARLAGAGVFALDAGNACFGLPLLGGSHLAEQGLVLGAALAAYEVWRVIAAWRAEQRGETGEAD